VDPATGRMIHDGRDIKLEPGMLIDATTGSHLWAQRYDGPLSNVFELQDDVVGNIISALSIKKGMDESPGLRREENGSAQACNYFLHARNRFFLYASKRDWKRTHAPGVCEYGWQPLMPGAAGKTMPTGRPSRCLP
jgi:hypothetical protein